MEEEEVAERTTAVVKTTTNPLLIVDDVLVKADTDVVRHDLPVAGEIIAMRVMTLLVTITNTNENEGMNTRIRQTEIEDDIALHESVVAGMTRQDKEINITVTGVMRVQLVMKEDVSDEEDVAAAGFIVELHLLHVTEVVIDAEGTIAEQVDEGEEADPGVKKTVEIDTIDTTMITSVDVPWGITTLPELG